MSADVDGPGRADADAGGTRPGLGHTHDPYDNVRVGAMLFTLVEPHPGHEVDYNRWYERDHFYAGCMIGPGWFAGRRWVATAELKRRRLADHATFLPDPHAGSYLATYWIQQGAEAEAIAWGTAQVQQLHRDGRMFPHRDHVHTLVYTHRFTVDRDAEVTVPTPLALDHPFPGLAVVATRRHEALGAREFSTWLADDCLMQTLEGSPIMKIAGFTPVPLPADAPVEQAPDPDADRRVLLLAFLDEAPATAWPAVEAVAATIDAGDAGESTWAAPFIPTIPGTDTYTDQLW